MWQNLFIKMHNAFLKILQNVVKPFLTVFQDKAVERVIFSDCQNYPCPVRMEVTEEFLGLIMANSFQ